MDASTTPVAVFGAGQRHDHRVVAAQRAGVLSNLRGPLTIDAGAGQFLYVSESSSTVSDTVT